ncbi:tetratricopeptide repeat protein [Aquimarina agarilytica]|uniref:tetratricopeptide repeat protein n=1 Tax=Aquimarina agarilytica TaxID=1087449 RepID=UPI0002897659|nr:hypothetical protein [Aquimarina agarilytica]
MKKLKETLKLSYKNLFVILVVLVGILMPFLSYDYGVHEDSRYHQEHGERLLQFYKGVDSVASQSPLNEKGYFVDVNKSLNHEHRGMNGFGGFFDLVANFCHQFFPSIGIYEFRNIINSLFGFLLFLFCGLLAKELGNWRSGVFSFVLVVLTPVLLGHSMSNPKDIPFAAFYVFSIYHIVKLFKEFPRVSVKRGLFLIINISLLINVRLVGLVVFAHLFLALFAWLIIENYKNGTRQINVKNGVFLLLKIIGISFLSYLATAIFWPYIQTKPFVGLIELFIRVKDFKGFENIQLFEGKWITSFSMPWYYMIKVLLFITMPIAILLSYVLIPFYYLEKDKTQKILFSILLFTSLFPLFLIVIGKPNSYDNARQFLFVVPPIIVAGALAWDNFLASISAKLLYKRVFVVVFVMLLLEPFLYITKNKQLIPLYFSPMIGGVEGAFKKYEIDYWGFSVKPAVDWLKKNVGSIEKPAKVRLFYGDQLKLSYYVDKSPNLTHVVAAYQSEDWDYSVVMFAEAKHNKSLLNNWPPKNTVHEVKVDGVTICAIIENKFEPLNEIAKLQKELKIKPSVSGFVRLGLFFYAKKEYVKSILANKKAIKLDPQNSIAYNNMCIAYNLLHMYAKAEEACENSLKYQFSELAKNNLKMAKENLTKTEVLSSDQYLALSNHYFLLGEYEQCITESNKLLKLSPKNSVAYNNICAAYNALGQYKQAKMACEQALEIKPEFQLAKNNLAISLKGLKIN